MASRVVPHEERDGVEVFHPRAWYLPRLGRRANARLYADSIRPLVLQLRERFPFDMIWATWGYPDVVGAVQLAQELNVPVVAGLHGSDVNYGFQLPYSKRAMLDAFRRCKAVITRSEAMRQALLREGLPRELIFCVYNGVDRDLFHLVERSDACARTNLDPHVKRILFVGHLVTVKGLTYLMDAFHALGRDEFGAPLELVLIGEGTDRRKLEAQARKLGVRQRVRFLGRRSHAELCAYFNTADVFCLPSLNEGLPNVVLEAFACGVPVVATRVGGVPELVNSENLGFLAQPANSRSLADALRHALRRSWDRQQILREIRQYDWKHSTDVTHELLQYAAGKAARPATVSLSEPRRSVAQAFQGRVRQLVTLALQSLPRMYQRDRQLFCFKVMESDGQIIPVDVSVRYTAMTIVGLQHATECGLASPMPVSQLLDGLVRNVHEQTSLGDLGLVLWAASVVDPARTEPILSRLQQRWKQWDALIPHDQLSMHIQWAINGVCAFVRHRGARGESETTLRDLHRVLMERHFNTETALFYYRAGQHPNLRTTFSHNAGYFAEQVYGIHALDCYAHTTGDQEAARLALRTAHALCDRQTSHGGWAWLYDVTTGDTLDNFPLYSVHQHGMGPLAMLPLARRGDGRLMGAVQAGIQWVFGDNELGESLFDASREIIWRSVKARHFARQRHLLHKALSIARLSTICRHPCLQPKRFAVDYECRPYELGWLLYALSDYKDS
jgi:glycosyltransferase involved in cell wall biosynthesis